MLNVRANSLTISYTEQIRQWSHVQPASEILSNYTHSLNSQRRMTHHRFRKMNVEISVVILLSHEAIVTYAHVADPL